MNSNFRIWIFFVWYRERMWGERLQDVVTDREHVGPSVSTGASSDLPATVSARQLLQRTRLCALLHRWQLPVSPRGLWMRFRVPQRDTHQPVRPRSRLHSRSFRHSRVLYARGFLQSKPVIIWLFISIYIIHVWEITIGFVIEGDIVWSLETLVWGPKHRTFTLRPLPAPWRKSPISFWWLSVQRSCVLIYGIWRTRNRCPSRRCRMSSP